MQKNLSGESRLRILFCLVVLGLLAAVIFLPNQFVSEAESNNDQSGLVITSSQDDGIVKMYDIREDKERADDLLQFRNRVGKSAVEVADVREGFVRGEEALKRQLPTAKVEYNLDIRTPEIITPDVYKSKIEYLTRPSSATRTSILRDFIKDNTELVGVTNNQIDNLVVVADYTNPDGKLSFVDFEQRINGIPVFRGEVKAGFTKKNEIIRVVNNLAPGLDYGSLATDFRNPSDAVKVAATHIKHELTAADVTRNDAASSNLKVVFGEGDWATTAEKMYFPTEPGIAVPAWRILIWQPVNAYYVIVDAETGVVLWHKNITDDQTTAATYNIYANSPAYINAADHAAPLSPGPNDPGLGTQGVLLTRTNRTLIGNEGANTFNQNGWITDGTNITDGNNTEAGVDRVAPNGVDAPLPGDTACPGAGCRVFTSTWNPPPGNPGPGDAPTDLQAQRGAVIQMFYLMNLYHDELYKRGFNEAARNFQQTNFSGMGIGNDRVSSEGQDSSGTNNANFATPADGGRGRMQMFVWTGPTPDRDGTADADIVIHEVTHGTSNRMHGNGSGLGNQGGMMGEGWGDWYAHTMLAEPTDNPNGVYSLGGYSLFQLSAGFTANFYYGIRRFPTALIASTGGPNNRPHNPLTFGHINSNCDTTLGTTTNAVSSAYPRSPVIATSGNCSQVHNAGEIWKSALWEVRALMIARLGFQDGTTRVLDVVTNGMKMAPLNPNMLQERDSIIAVASAITDTPADVLDVREGFRRRGFGFSASVQSASSVTEAFDSADLSSSNAASVTSGNNILEPNECNTLNVPLTNNSGNPVTGVNAVLSTTTPGITVTQPNSAYPDIPGGGGPVNNTTPFEVSVNSSVACFTTANFTMTVTYSGGGGGSPLTFNFSLPVGIQGLDYNFTSGTGTIPAGGTFIPLSDDDDFVVDVPLPSGWTSTVYGTPVTSLRASTNGNMTVNGPGVTTFTNTALPGTTFGGTPTLFPYWDDLDMDVADVTGGGIFVNTVGTAPNRQLFVEWRAQHFSETVNGPITTNFAILLTEGSDIVRYIYNSTGINAQLNGGSATVGIQAAATGTRFTQFSFNTPSLSAGLQLQAERPAGVCSPGSGTCNVAPRNKRADFDGDGRTDLSVFRPTDGNWYINRSTAGFTAVSWGASTDTLVPADFDGDGKTDVAVFRPANGGWYYIKSSDSTFVGLLFGQNDDMPIPGDFDGDGKDDINVFRPSNGFWYRLNSSNSQPISNAFGQNGDKPLVGDFNGDGKADLAVFRPSAGSWYIAKPTGVPAQNFDAYTFGFGTDLPTPADYDGDGKTDIAVFRPSNGGWYRLNSSNGQFVGLLFGQNGDVPVPGDYDGDGKYDQAVVRSGTWYVNQSTSGFFGAVFGFASDKPLPKQYIP